MLQQLEAIEVEDSTMADGIRLRNIEETINEDIKYHIEENHHDENSAIVDIDTSIPKMEALHTKKV